MPIQITSTIFNDFSGNSTSYYKSNAGDEIELIYQIRSIIRITSQSNPLTIDPILTIVTSPSVSWIDEGFRIGDWCLVNLRDSSGSVLNTTYAQISYCDDTIADFSNIGFWYDIGNNEIIEFIALDFFNSPTPPTNNNPRLRSDIDILINHSKNSLQGNEFSLIDGEVSRYIFTGVENMSIGGAIVGQSVGKQSGQFIVNARLTRGSNNADGWIVHTLTIVVINSGVYDQSWFNSSDCLKLYIKGLQASLSGEPYDRTEFIYDDSANTGWFNEGNNTSVYDSTLIQGTNEIDYCIASNHSVIVETTDPNIGMGSCYISTNDAYYRNVVPSQIDLTMILATDQIAIGTRTSQTNPSGAQYSIEITAITIVAPNQTQIDFRFIPNANFDTFFSNLDDGDRLFYVWIKAGNVNHLVFADQLTCDPPIGGALVMKQTYAFLDHSQNVTEIVGNQSNINADTEDDLAYYGTFGIEYNEICDNFRVRIEAYNTLTEDAFTLQETNFSFNSVQLSNSGVYLLNESLNIDSTLPNTSVKRNALLKLEPLADGITDYGVSIYYPFLLNWKYWLTQSNANVDFYPTQNKNWEQYDNIGDWILRIELNLTKQGLAYTHTENIIDSQYDNDPDILSTLQLIKNDDNTIVSVIPEGELIRIESFHQKLTGNWDQTKTWGMLTIEPKESTPRYILSSVVDFDNNGNNPLYPITGNYVSLTYPAPDIAKMSCYFDPSKINLNNGVKITAKIKQGCLIAGLINKLTTDDEEKLTTSDNNKILS